MGASSLRVMFVPVETYSGEFIGLLDTDDGPCLFRLSKKSLWITRDFGVQQWNLNEEFKSKNSQQAADFIVELMENTEPDVIFGNPAWEK